MAKIVVGVDASGGRLLDEGGETPEGIDVQRSLVEDRNPARVERSGVLP